VVAAGAGVIAAFFAVQRMADTAAAAAVATAAARAAADRSAAPPSAALASAPAPKKKKKAKMTMAQSLAFLARSEYLGLICALVLAYGLSIEFTEIMWKAVVKKQMPDKRDYAQFMGQYSTAVGVVTLLMTLVGGKIPELLGCAPGERDLSP
jgi:AAA family ATP:ADP antiporter